MWVLLWHSDLDVNVVISIAVAVHPPNAFPLQPDHLISLATGRDLKRQMTFKYSTVLDYIELVALHLRKYFH